MLTWSVPSRAIREGQAFRAIASPTASGQRSAIVGEVLRGPEARKLALDRVRQPFHRLTSTMAAGLGREQGRVRRGDHGLAEPRDRGGEGLAAARGRAPRGRRRGAGAAAARAARPRRAGARARPAAARPAIRSREARGRRRSTRSSRCGPRPVVPRIDVGVQAALERLDRRRVAFVGEPAARKPEPRQVLAEPGLERRRGRAARLDQLRPERRDALRPRRDGVPRRERRAGRAGALRSAGRAPPRSPAGARPAPGTSRASARSR